MGSPSNLTATVEVEEVVYTFKPANNGSGPQWCFGSPTLVRLGEEVFASGLETIPDARPLNNVRLMLYRRGQSGPWELVFRDGERTREPGPLGVTPAKSRLYLTANPTRAPADAEAGPAEPQVLEFSAAEPKQPPKALKPAWSEPVQFTEHSYRSFAVDGQAGELICLNNLGYDRNYWSLRNRAGEWSASGALFWPKPHRLCYPAVLIRNRAVHFLGISDDVEPDAKLHEFKKNLTGKEWDYLFCKLYYSATPDVSAKPFVPWLLVADRLETRGQVWACDLWLDGQGVAHLLWFEKSVDDRLREKFFPQTQWTEELNYARVKNGQVLLRKTLLAGEGPGGALPKWGRFHVTPAGRLLVVTCSSQNGKLHNGLMEVLADGSAGSAVRLALAKPFAPQFFTATPRGGSAPSKYLDLLGAAEGDPQTIRYARVSVE